MPEIDVHVSGLKEVEMALRRVDPVLRKEMRADLKAIGNRVAADARRRVVADVARPKVRPSRSKGRAARSIRAMLDTKGQTKVVVVGGKKILPYYGWLDFGGELKPTGKRHNTQMRPIKRRGRYLYPAVDANRDATIRAFGQAVDRSLTKAGLR